MPSLPWDWRPSSFPSLHPWRLECDPRRDPAARREGLQQRSTPMAALNGERWGGDLENCGGLGGTERRCSGAVGVGLGNQLDSRWRTGEVPSLQPWFPASSSYLCFPSLLQTFRLLGVKVWRTSVCVVHSALESAYDPVCTAGCLRHWTTVPT